MTRTIAHISDLHFGRTDASIVHALREAVVALKPDLLVVSGDLTQRARRRQFAEARRFLDSIPVPRVVVPGNHDVPLYDVLSRWLRPLGNYRRHIGTDAEPFYADPDIAVAGINTARSLTWKQGRINAGQVAVACKRFATAPSTAVRCVVTHHPFDDSRETKGGARVGRSETGMAGFAACRVDLILSGHAHVWHAGHSATRYPIGNYACVLVRAGTATSTRTKGEHNSWNVVRVDRDRLGVSEMAWTSDAFAPRRAQDFRRGSAGWEPCG